MLPFFRWQSSFAMTTNSPAQSKILCLSLLLFQCLISPTHTETWTKLWKLLFPGEFDLNSSWNPDCVLALWCYTFLTPLPSLILCIITEKGKFKQEACNTGETLRSLGIWAQYGDMLRMCAWDKCLDTVFFFFSLRTLQRVLLLITY